MSENKAPKPAIVPFAIGDILLLCVAGFIVYASARPLDVWQAALCTACVAMGAWILIIPFRLEYQAATRLAENESLKSTLEQIQQLQEVGRQIQGATSQWVTVQEQAARTANVSKEFADRMAAEGAAFTEAMQKLNDKEKATLRLEVEKARRAEGEWLQVSVRTLDHVHALHQAGLQSGHPRLIEQLAQFQNACRETARRVGLVAYEAQPGEPFDANGFQLANPAESVPDGARVGQCLAPGYTFQTQLLRPALVNLQVASPPIPQGNVFSAVEVPTAPAPSMTEEIVEEPEVVASSAPMDDYVEPETVTDVPVSTAASVVAESNVESIPAGQPAEDPSAPTGPAKKKSLNV